MYLRHQELPRWAINHRILDSMQSMLCRFLVFPLISISSLKSQIHSEEVNITFRLSESSFVFCELDRATLPPDCLLLFMHSALLQAIDWSLLPRAVLGVLALLCGNGFIVGINQIYDVDVDTVNKPFLPVAAGRSSRVYAASCKAYRLHSLLSEILRVCLRSHQWHVA